MTLIMFISFGIISWFGSTWKNKDITRSIWFDWDADNFLLSLVVGLSSNIVFGFIDNAGLFFGASFLDEWFQNLPGSDDANVFAG
jgi:hypothetical protein